MEEYELIVVGGGTTGYAAALYAGRFRLKTLVLAREKGGLITWAHLVENYPGIKSITGYELAKKIEDHALSNGAEIRAEEALKITSAENECYVIKTDKAEYHAKAVILATGTKVRELGVPGEQEFKNKGVHYCAACDGAFYQDKIVGVVGGSDSSVSEALMLSAYAKKVFIIYRGEKVRAEPITVERMEHEKKIGVINNANVKEIMGKGKLTHVALDREFNGSKELKLDALFIAIGRIPQNNLAKQLGVELNAGGEVIIDFNSKTNVPGVFAAGDITARVFKQAIVGAGEAVIAAHEAFEYIKGK